MKFLEIEHKYLVTSEYDVNFLIKKLNELKPRKITDVDVSDTYFISSLSPKVVLRHRIDKELQQLTIKSFGNSTEVRQEVNLDLGDHKGDQFANAKAFCKALGFSWHGSLRKAVKAFYFDDCEVVFYTATAADRRFNCLELEAVDPKSLDSALRTLKKYETYLGLNPSRRCDESLFELVFPEQAAHLKQEAEHQRQKEDKE